MDSENKQCQNCKQSFVVEPEDFAFYEKIGVPPPTFCPDCRFQRRLVSLNERSLYKRPCGLCGKSIVSMYSPDKPFPVYCPPCWWSDKWDGLAYGIEYDSNQPFLEQVRDLVWKTPHISLSVEYPSLVNSEYVNYCGHLKNCYLIYIADFCENVLYSSILANDKDSMDCIMLGESELCYWDINCGHDYRVFFSEDTDNCQNVYFSKSCVNCSDCFGCVNLRGKQYHIWNQPYSKEEYAAKLKEFRLDSHASIEDLKKRAVAFWQTAPHKFIHERHNVNVSGDYVYTSKNAHNVYEVRGVEDGRYCQIITLKPTKDAYDYTNWGNNAQRIYECASVGEGADTVKFSVQCWPNVLDVEYSVWTISSAHMFGCANIKKKQHCILNKQYNKEEFDRLKAKIIADMKERPYRDERGRLYPYGEFFPIVFSPFDYNETDAMDYFPLSREEASSQGYRWYEPQPSPHKPTLAPADILDSIRDVSDSILKEILECAWCRKAFRLVPAELILLRRLGFPIPRKCPNCRHRERMNRVNPPRLWKRACSRCGTEIQTSYAPGRPEIIYCDACYRAEIV